jgi:hypothetical protein
VTTGKVPALTERDRWSMTSISRLVRLATSKVAGVPVAAPRKSVQRGTRSPRTTNRFGMPAFAAVWRAGVGARRSPRATTNEGERRPPRRRRARARLGAWACKDSADPPGFLADPRSSHYGRRAPQESHSRRRLSPRSVVGVTAESDRPLGYADQRQTLPIRLAIGSESSFWPPQDPPGGQRAPVRTRLLALPSRSGVGIDGFETSRDRAGTRWKCVSVARCESDRRRPAHVVRKNPVGIGWRQIRELDVR